ncbi:MAG TPA: biotin-dependent carboxyltransferase family protein [Pyrinomonadaceae bacterium]|nr:biotin-dependent carboxyltransferase family protein [Pyrinomonadaceae bacterium]
MPLIIRKPGILTTVQDLGRTGARRFCINPCGVMDTTAARIANTLVGSDESSAVIETHFPAVELEFDADTTFAISGADFGAKLSRKSVRNWSVTKATAGDVLTFSKKGSGSRAYIAVHGGILCDGWLGSSSTNLAIGDSKLVAGDLIDCESGGVSKDLSAGLSLLPRYNRFPTVRIVAGPEFEFLTASSERTFLTDGFTLTNDCNRMGYRLSGKPVHLLHAREMVSAAVAFGTIQLLPDGQLIVLMADHQTSGGYPRIGNVISVDLPLLAQLGPNDGVSFQLVSVNEAEHLAQRFERELNYLRVGCKLQRQNAFDRS